LTFDVLCRWYERMLAKRTRAGERPMIAAERVFGLLQSGAMEEPYVIRVLQSLEARVAELYFHPTTAPEAVPLGPNPGDLATLRSPAVRRTIVERRLELASYATVKEVS